jgi:hypothetical protein
MRIRTDELQRGQQVTTRRIFDDFVLPAPPSAGGTLREVDDVTRQPTDRKSDPDRIVFFTDGTRAFTHTTTYWTVTE